MIESWLKLPLEFRQPDFLWFALAAPIVFYLAIRAPGSITFSSQRLLPSTSFSWRRWTIWIPPLLFAAGAVTLAIGAAGPRRGDETTQVQQEGISIALVVDMSGSMNYLDMDSSHKRFEDRRTRLEIVNEVVADFVPKRENDLIGLFSFGRYADTLCPFTPDAGNLVEVIRGLEIFDPSHDDHSRTALGEGLGLACEKLNGQKTQSKVIILLTDGASNHGALSPTEATDLAAKLGIRIYAIGIGSKGRTWIRVRDPRTGLPAERGPFDVGDSWDEPALQRIARDTEGLYFRAGDEEGLREVYDRIDELEQTETRQLRYVVYHEQYAPWVWASLALVGAAALLAQTIWRRIP